MRKRSKSKATLDKADRALQDWYRRQYPKGKCEICGLPFDVMHHFVPKSQSKALRFDDEKGNLVFICNGCHFRHHRTANPMIHGTVIKKRGMDWYNNLMDRQHKEKRDYFGKKELEDIIKRYIT